MSDKSELKWLKRTGQFRFHNYHRLIVYVSLRRQRWKAWGMVKFPKFTPYRKTTYMQFVVIAYDGTDKEANERRMKARPMHLEAMEELRRNGNFHYGGAILDDNEQMVGSVVVCEFPGWDEMEAWLENEPYVIGGVWQKIEVKPFRLAKFQ